MSTLTTSYVKPQLDHRSINPENIQSLEIQRELKDLADKWILRDRIATSLMKPKWDKNILYYEGHMVPLGFSGDPMAEFVSKNGLNRGLKDQDDQIFFPNNLCKPVIDNQIGDYTKVNKSILVSQSKF